jgi:hypothetical protein
MPAVQSRSGKIQVASLSKKQGKCSCLQCKAKIRQLVDLVLAGHGGIIKALVGVSVSNGLLYFYPGHIW